MIKFLLKLPLRLLVIAVFIMPFIVWIYVKNWEIVGISSVPAATLIIVQSVCMYTKAEKF